MRKIDYALNKSRHDLVEKIVKYIRERPDDYDEGYIISILEKYKDINAKDILILDCPFKYGLLDSETCSNCDECWESEVEELT